MRKRLLPYSIPEPVLNQWEKRYQGKLLPLQYRAIEDYKLMEGDSLLISAPTSAGKTFCGEMALIRAIQQRQKAIFLVPLKAVAEEKYRQFADCYGGIGLKVLIGTHDHPENDTDIENGRFDIAVMVYEKFNSLLLTNLDILGQIGTVVIDELQMLEDESRGARLELALAKLLYCDYSPQIVALSAVLGEADDLAEWLGCRLLLEKNRPVELRRGVASDGKFYFRCHNSGDTGEESCPRGENTIDTLFKNIEEAAKSNQSVLVFLKSKIDTANAARKFAKYAGLESDDKKREYFLSQLGDEENSSLLDNLISLLSCGIAFHNADLTIGQRMAVEEGYRKGYIKAVFATTTLSTGINLPASTVFVEAQKYNFQGYTGKPGLEPLSWGEYESMSGRAGRVGLLDKDIKAGRAVLFASCDLEKSILWDYYIDNRANPLSSRLDTLPVEDIILDLFGSQLVKRPEDINQLLSRTFFAVRNGRQPKINAALYAQLMDEGFLNDRGEEIAITALGMAVVVTGLGIATARKIIRDWDLSWAKPDEEIFFDILDSPVAQNMYLPGIGFGGGALVPSRHLHGASPLIRHFSSRLDKPTADEMRRVRLAFLLIDWKSGLSALDIENDYHLHLGMMDSLARQMAWLLSSSAAVIKTIDNYSKLPGLLNGLAFSAGTGLPIELKEIHDAVGNILHRGEILNLYRNEIFDLKEMLDKGPAIISQNIFSEIRLNKIERQFQKIKENKMNANVNITRIADSWPQSIEIDGTAVRERFRVRINGQTINLTGKSFKYLCRLAWSRLTRDNGWLYKEDLEQGFNQARYLYRLRQEIGRDFLPGWPLYENNRSGYYRLAAPPDSIKVNVDALNDNPDFEIRKMGGDLKPLMMTG
ncbi:MAG: DEAD/DEAH box helicase [Candidatus Zixiibacteriota bacterium]